MSSSQHVIPVSTYLKVFLALMALTTLTVWVAFKDLGALSNVVAIGIAVTKATLVVLYFMHVRYGTRLTTLVVVSAVAWLVILIGFTLADYDTRNWLIGPPGVEVGAPTTDTF